MKGNLTNLKTYQAINLMFINLCVQFDKFVRQSTKANTI